MDETTGDANQWTDAPRVGRTSEHRIRSDTSSRNAKTRKRIRSWSMIGEGARGGGGEGRVERVKETEREPQTKSTHDYNNDHDQYHYHDQHQG